MSKKRQSPFHRAAKNKQQQPDSIPAQQCAPESFEKRAHDEWELLQELEVIFAALPEAVLACNRDGTLFFMNAAACQLFEVPSEHHYLGTSYREFLHRYEIYDERHRPIFLAPWLLDSPEEEGTKVRPYDQTLVLGLPSGLNVSLELFCASALNAQQQVVGLVSIFHEITPRYRKALHLQRVYEAVLALNETVAHIPEQLFFHLTTVEAILLSPPMLFISQKLVDLIRQVLDCWRVSLISFGMPEYRFYYVVGSGFSAEQERLRWEMRGQFSSADFADRTIIARLEANQEVILASDRISMPPGHPSLGAANLLIIPLFFQQKLVGMLCVHKEGWGSGYAQEEIDLVRAVAAQALLILECLDLLPEQTGPPSSDLILYELNRLSKEFLTLASHELRTPLTAIKGNLQLAQRQLAMLKRQIAERPEHALEQVQRTQRTLESATKSTRVQERMVQDIIDDARIQTNQLQLQLKPCDLLVLLREAVMKQQWTFPERKLVLEIPTTLSMVPVLADAERITRVLTIYLTNVLTHSPADQPVTVGVTVEHDIVRVAVHGEGPGIPAEEQGRIWERFYRGKGGAFQQELDLSLGLSFYLCRAFIERHGGNVGVESNAEQGTTFWLTLPLARTAEA